MSEILSLALLSVHHPVELLLLCAAVLVLVGVLCRLGLSIGGGLIAAGITVGTVEAGSNLDRQLLQGTAEVGALALLFLTSARFRASIGARLPRGLKVSAAYVLLTSLMASLVFLKLGVGWKTGLFTSLLLALPCTPTLRGRMLVGRRAWAVADGALGMIGLSAILLLLPALPVLGQADADIREVVRSYLVGLPMVVIAFVLATRWFPDLAARLERERSAETALVRMAAVVSVPLLIAHLIELPLAYGVVAGGMLVGGTRFGGRSLGDSASLRWMAAALFLIPLGMMFDYSILVDKALVIGAALGGLVVLKLGTLAAATMMRKRRGPEPFRLPMSLAPMGALSFLVLVEGQSQGLVPGGPAAGSQLVVTLMALLLLTYLVANGFRKADVVSSNAKSWPTRLHDYGPAASVGTIASTLNGFTGFSDEGGNHTSSCENRSRWGWVPASKSGSSVPVLSSDLSVSVWDVSIKKGAHADGCTVDELNRHREFTAILIGFWRRDVYHSHPPPDRRLRAGDRLLLSGTAGQMNSAADLFARPDGSTRDRS